MKVNGVGQPALVTKAATTHFDGLDPAVEAFRRTLAPLEGPRIKDTPPVSLDGPGRRFDRLQSAPHHPGPLALPVLAGPGAARIVPPRLGPILEAPRSGRLQRTGTPRLETGRRPVGRVGPPVLSGPFEIGPSGLHPGPVFRTPPLVHGRIQTWSPVEPVQRPLRLGPKPRLQRGVDRGRPPIHANPLDVLQLLRRETGIPLRKGGFRPVYPPCSTGPT